MQPRMQTDPQPSTGTRPERDTSGTPAGRWGLGTRIAFRFAFVYFLLYTHDTLFQFFPFPPISQVASAYESLLATMVMWVSKHLLHLQHDFSLDYLNRVGGSQDTTSAYVRVFCCFLIATL